MLKSLDRPYICAVPATFQTFEEWKDSELGLHPVQVALQVALPELAGAIAPMISVCAAIAASAAVIGASARFGAAGRALSELLSPQSAPLGASL